jgi:CRP/FNR family cyclic AMP-dependent transcriptional regulator
MAKKSQPVDWEAALAGIAGGNTVLEDAAKHEILSKQTKSVMARKRIPIDVSAFRKKRKAVTANRKRHSDVVTSNRKDQAEVATALKKGQPAAITANQTNQPVDWDALLAGINGGKSVIEYSENRVIFRQGDPADALFYLRRGKVKLAVTSQQGKEAIVAILGAGEFFGEGCLAGQPLRVSTAIAVTDCTLARIEKSRMARMLHNQHDISELFVTHLLSRNIRYEEDLVDQLFNSSEKRLARILLLLAHFGKEGRSESVLPRINQENLAQMVGTTRSRVSHFMNKFKKLGFVDYDGTSGGLTVHSGLLSVILHD